MKQSFIAKIRERRGANSTSVLHEVTIPAKIRKDMELKKGQNINVTIEDIEE